ncbi:MAG: hypothetical protein LBT31_03990 [Synergistaceae bacterium]|jgi:hypothetical protein|nr:hypothetical protein [Synergistaceae bacterium]
MPVIKNIDSVSHHYNGEVFPPGKEKTIQYFPPRDEPWVSVISDIHEFISEAWSEYQNNPNY